MSRVRMQLRRLLSLTIALLAGFSLLMASAAYAEGTAYTVSFDTNGGSDVPSQSVESGSTATKPEEDPVKDRYDFGGWYADALCKTPYTFSEKVTASITVHAKWNLRQSSLIYERSAGAIGTLPNDITATSSTVQIAANKLTKSGSTPFITLDWNDGSAPVTVTGSSAVTYAANGWLGSDGKTYADAASYTFNGKDLTLITRFKMSPTPSFVIPDHTREGYIFKGWMNAKTNGAIISTSLDTIPDPQDSVTYYASWQKQATLTYRNEDAGITGKVPSAVTAGVGTELTIADNQMAKAPAESKVTVTFNRAGGTGTADSAEVTVPITWQPSGWNTSADGTGDAVSGTFVLKQDTVIYPVFTETTGKADLTLPDAVRDGFVMQGWFDAAQDGNLLGKVGDTISVSADETIYAQWKEQEMLNVTISFHDTDANPQDLSAYAQTYTVPAGVSTPLDLSAQIKKITDLGYEMVSAVPTESDGIAKEVSLDVSHRREETSETSASMHVHRTITYTIPGASSPTVINQQGTYQTVTKSIKDLVTGSVDRQVTYVTITGLSAVNIPSFTGYTASMTSVPAVTAFDEASIKDSTVAVTYAKNADSTAAPGKVVTCPEAGFGPDSYWDESKKACVNPPKQTASAQAGSSQQGTASTPAATATPTPSASAAASSTPTPSARPTATASSAGGSSNSGSGSWAIMNLVLTILAAACALYSILKREAGTRSLIAMILSGGGTAASIAMMVLTQHLAGHAEFLDGNTVWFAAAAVISIIGFVLTVMGSIKDAPEE